MKKCVRCNSGNIQKVYGMKDTAFGDFWYSIRKNYQGGIAEDFKKAYPNTKASFRDFGYVADSCEECGFRASTKFL